MRNPLLLLVSISFISITSSYNNIFAQELILNQEAQTQVAQTNSENNGLVILTSPHGFLETTNRLESIIQEKGLTLFTSIDHAANANKIGEELKPTKLIIFGNPKVGTPLMKCSRIVAIDLPQKILVFSDEQQQTKIAYNQPDYLNERHSLAGCEQVLEKVSGVLKGITEQAIQP